MKGLELAERYFHELGLPMITERFPLHAPRIACGLVGDGSECYGFDDEISRDHDWGPGFCIWLTPEDYSEIGEALMREYEKLPGTFMGFGPRRTSQWGGGRVGIFEIGAFYKRFIGRGNIPQSLEDWLFIPEQAIAAATNGKVFSDELGVFSSFRKHLLDFYPEDIRLKKIAARCMTTAQAGQYNLGRCLTRGDLFASQYAETKFCADTISLMFLLNRRYTPYYKWMYRALGTLPMQGETINDAIVELMVSSDPQTKLPIVEKICTTIIDMLREQGLTDSSSDFLLDHGPQVQSRIRDSAIRERNVWIG